MSKIFKVSTFCLSFVVALSAAQQTISDEKRLHSVRENIDKEAVMEVKQVSAVDNLKHMFKDAKVSGQMRMMYADYEEKAQNIDNNYATALGGKLKYELAELNGFNGGVAFYTSHDINFATGDNTYHNNEFSSSNGSYTQIAEAYINYKYKDFNFRAGRQILDTPLADSDDIRMISNTFEGYVASYNYNGFDFMAGHIDSFGGYDAGLDTPWIKTGKNGTNFGGVSYNDVWELNLWYYNVTDTTNALYFDGGIEYNINKDIMVHGMVQYLNETELAGSGYESEIYGAMAEVVTHGVSFGIAYDKSFSSPSKLSFSGFGGGTLFTSMDTLILDDIADDRDARSLVSQISYEIQEFEFLYAYGDFKGGANSMGKKAHVTEQDVSLEYNVNDDFIVFCVYAMQDDKENLIKTEHDWNHLRVMINYNF